VHICALSTELPACPAGPNYSLQLSCMPCNATLPNLHLTHFRMQYMPNFFFGALLLWFGIEISRDWLVLSFRKFSITGMR
jgi:hypothetical protein